jgi:hypothetical protein
MKTSVLMLTILAASMSAFAQPQKPTPPSQSQTAFLKVELVKQQKVQVSNKPIFVPFTVAQPAPKQKVERVDGMSSRPWAQIVGSHPGWPAIPPPERHEQTWRILQINF